MGHKVNPTSYRLNTLYDWQSRWFNERKYRDQIQEDVRVRDWLFKKLKTAMVAKVMIERSARGVTITIFTSRPGVLIGRGGSGAEELRKEISRMVAGKPQVKLNVEEVRDPDKNARLVAINVAEQLEKRMPFRRIVKSSVERAMSAGAQGVRINVAGRLNGADMSRTEWQVEGSVPLHTLRADIDYAQATARTTYGAIGVKVWVYKGQRFEHESAGEAKPVVTGQQQLTAPIRGARG